MRHFTARYLEDVGPGEGVFEDVIPGELSRPNLSTVLVDEFVNWLEVPNLSTPTEVDVAGRATATMLVRMSMEEAGEHLQGASHTPLTRSGVPRRKPMWLRLAVDTPFLIQDRVLKFTVSKEGTGTAAATVGWQVTVLLEDGTDYVISGTVDIPEGETSAQVTIDFDEISLPPSNYASVGLYWSWGIPMHSSSSLRQKSVSIVNEDAPFYTRSLVHEPWLYWGDHTKPWEDLSGNGRTSSGTPAYSGIVPGAPGCYGSAAVALGRYIGSGQPAFPSPLSQWSVSTVFRPGNPDKPEIYLGHVMGSGNMGIVILPGTDEMLDLAISWYNHGIRRVFTSVSRSEWHHLVVTFDGTTYEAYLNGSPTPIWDQPPSNVISGNSFEAGVAGAWVGRGYIENNDFAVWDRVLSPSDVEYIYAGLG